MDHGEARLAIVRRLELVQAVTLTGVLSYSQIVEMFGRQGFGSRASVLEPRWLALARASMPRRR